MTTTFKALLWKDYRQNRLLLVASLIMLVASIPFVWLIAWLNDASFEHEMMLAMAIYGVMPTSILVVAMLGGTIIAADRADRSAIFLAYLPPTRKTVLLSKALCAGSTTLVILIINLALLASLFLLIWTSRPWSGPFQWQNLLQMNLVMVATALLIFGTAWFAGSLLGSPAIASCIGVGIFMVLGSAIFLVNARPGVPYIIQQNIPELYAAIAGLFGLTFFIAGCLHSLYRKSLG